MYGAELALGVSQFGGLKVSVIFPVPRRQADKQLPETSLGKNIVKA
jgi:two-component system sensor histidine kinase QseC